MRCEQANLGVEKLRSSVDSLIVINNNKLREVYGNLGFKAGFSKADEVLATAARGIAEVITHHYTQNIDLRDAKTVLSNSGTAIMGSSIASGSNRASEAISKALDSPLLNDNKIKGATNVLLLIVSGSEEITIDEIGEISDYIQSEAGHGANIIMGVGDDESLEESIAITVIATGFNPEQQNDIVNTEAKKVIHILEDEQRAEQVLLSSPSETKESLVSTPETVILKEEEPIIKHTLFDEDEEIEEVVSKKPFEDYIETSDLLKDIDVSYEEIDIHHLAEFKEVNIDEIDINEFVIVDSNSENLEKSTEAFTEVNATETEEQILMFDMPVDPVHKVAAKTSNKDSDSEDISFKEIETITSNIEDIEVRDHVEVVPITEISNKETVRYSLDDYQDVEDQLTNAKPKEEEVSEDEIVFEKRIIEVPEETQVEESSDPFNTPISKLLSDRTEIRKKQMKEFNYKFKNKSSHIDDIENQPAYKRMGIELDDAAGSQDPNISRISLNSDDDDIDFRTNNSFLHDNVD